MLGDGIYGADAISSGSFSSSVAPTFGVTTSRCPSVMAYLAERACHAVFLVGTCWPGTFEQQRGPSDQLGFHSEDPKRYSCSVGSPSEESQ